MRDNLLLQAEKTFKVSKPAFIFLFGAVVLSGILAVATVNNINRGLQLMKLSFLRQGTSMIHSFEAGTRASMMFSRPRNHNPLADLTAEMLKDDGVAYIRIFDEQGNSIVSQGVIPPALVKTDEDIAHISETPVSAISWKNGIFDVTRQFLPIEHGKATMPMMARHWQQWNMDYKPKGRVYISVGFYTDEFEAARKGDMYHTLFMLVMLILLFLAGLYFLYLYQKMRVTHGTLLNTRLYADNILESIPDGLISLAPDNSVVSCNKNAEALLGRSIGDIVGQGIFEVFPSCPQEIFGIDNTFREFDAKCHLEAEEVVPVKVGSARLNDHLGNWIGCVLVLRDIREIRKIEIQLERSRRLAALGAMAAGIAHEVRNPLGTLRGFAHFFGAEKGASASCKKYAGFMKSEVDRLNHLVSGLLQFGAPRDLNFAKIDVDVFIGKIGTLLGNDFTKNMLQFSCHKDENMELYGDPDLLMQVIFNLLKNSINATPPGGEIFLEFSLEKDCAKICVRDSGHGMTLETQGKMFDPFFTDRKDGTGLGLAVCHQVIEQHQGHFEVISQLEHGTSVVIVLPLEGKDHGK